MRSLTLIIALCLTLCLTLIAQAASAAAIVDQGDSPEVRPIFRLIETSFTAAYDRSQEADAVQAVPVSFARPGYVCDATGCRPVASAPSGSACGSCNAGGNVRARLRSVQPVRRVLGFLRR